MFLLRRMASCPGILESFNSLVQSPCTTTVALGGACHLLVHWLHCCRAVYLGPTQLAANSCRCSTAYYSLFSPFVSWSIYDQKCTYVYNQVFIDPIPSIVVPHYAYLDRDVVTIYFQCQRGYDCRWSRIISCSSSNKRYNFKSYCYQYLSRWHKQEIKCWGDCWWCRWGCCP